MLLMERVGPANIDMVSRLKLLLLIVHFLKSLLSKEIQNKGTAVGYSLFVLYRCVTCDFSLFSFHSWSQRRCDKYILIVSPLMRSENSAWSLSVDVQTVSESWHWNAACASQWICPKGVSAQLLLVFVMFVYLKTVFTPTFSTFASSVYKLRQPDK